MGIVIPVGALTIEVRRRMIDTAEVIVRIDGLLTIIAICLGETHESK